MAGCSAEAVRYATHTLRTAEDDLVIVLALGVVHALVVLWVRCHDDRLRVVARPPWETLPQLLGQEGHEGVHHPQSIIKSCVQGIKSALLLGFGAVADDGFAVLNPEPRSHASQRGRSVVLRQVSKHELSSLVDLVAEVALMRENRRASAPHSSMPSGNACFCHLAARSISLAARLPTFNLSVRPSRAIPSMMSTGSMTLPRDLDILRPSESRIKLWQ
ncbi:hypothetical protein KC323_g259 [Hortaea werneckii]|nr:hypothetical protein KC323_g259 [Hortaea werneckii]